MDRKKKSYNLLIGIAALVAIVAAVALVGYIVSEPDQGLGKSSGPCGKVLCRRRRFRTQG